MRPVEGRRGARPSTTGRWSGHHHAKKLHWRSGSPSVLEAALEGAEPPHAPTPSIRIRGCARGKDRSNSLAGTTVGWFSKARLESSGRDALARASD